MASSALSPSSALALGRGGLAVVRFNAGRGVRWYGYVHVEKKRPPHLLGHGSEWRQCYVVRAQAQGQGCLDSYQWLTGSQMEEGLPASFPSLPHGCGTQEEEAVMVRVQEAARQAPLRRERDSIGQSLLSSALAGVWMTGTEHLKRSSLIHNPRVESYWRRSGHNFVCMSNPLFILHSPEPLQLFSDPLTTSSLPPSPHPLLTEDRLPSQLGLFRQSFDQLSPSGGCHRLSPTRFTHTVLSQMTLQRARDHLLAHGLMQLFSQAAGECVQNGYPLDQDLAYPLASQGLVASGNQLTFLCYQLNTLDLRSQRGSQRANHMWVGPTLDLVTEEGEVSRECVRMLLRAFLHQPTRDKPSLSGFSLRREAERRRRGRGSCLKMTI